MIIVATNLNEKKKKLLMNTNLATFYHLYYYWCEEIGNVFINIHLMISHNEG